LEVNPTSALLRTLLLARLQHADNYPSGLARQLTAEGVRVEAAQASTLMAQLQEDGYADSKWVFNIGPRPQRWYTMNDHGRSQISGIVDRTVRLYRCVLDLLED
jgi:DNA-binding PadR family transcriptional regulator